MTQQRSPDLNSLQSLDNFSRRGSYRNRQILLNKVRNYWLRGVLEKSLHGRALIELGLEERLDAIESPLNSVWETPEQPRQPLPNGTRLIDKFDEMGEGRSLLILGEPGSGKTTALLELARNLVKRAEQDIHQPIPVVLNLSSWTSQEQTLGEWLVAELYTQYQLPKLFAQVWVMGTSTEGLPLLPMLDGLDEVGEEHRASCVQALNQFVQEHGQAEIVVCSRLRDYETLPEPLRLQRAIYLQPLTSEQVHHYLAEAGSDMAALSTLLQEDVALSQLATTPLMLSIMTFAYQEMSVEDLPSPNSIEDRRKHLFNAYIQRMLTRRKTRQPYTKVQLMHWLTQMAYRMSQQSQTVLLIERLQPSWLQINLQDGYTHLFLGKGQRKTQAFQVYTRAAQLINGSIWGLIIGLFCVLISDSSAGMVPALVSGLIAGLITKVEPIKPVESLKWSWEKARNWLPFGLLFGASGWLSGGLFWGLVLGGSGVAFTGLLGSTVETTTVPNQGIWQSLKNAIAFSLIGGTLSLVGAAGIEGSLALPELLSIPILTGGIVGLILALSKGGTACIQHFTLRLVLYCYRSIPWNLSHFLNYAAERAFLQKVGGGYIFIHRLLQEHFAALGLENYIQGIQISPNDAEAYLKRGKAYASIGDNQRAMEDFTQALEINPGLAEAYAGRSQARFGLGDYQGVIEDYDQTVQLNSHLARGISYTSQDSSYSALAATPETVEDEPRSYLVILLNDNFNAFDHVNHCLVKYIPGMTSDRAWTLTHKVHQEGQAIVWSGRQELAALYRMQLSHAGLSMAFLEQAEVD